MGCKMKLASSLLLLASLLGQVRPEIKVPGGAPMQTLLGLMGIQGEKKQAEFIEKLNPLDAILYDILPLFFAQSPSNVNGSLVEFKEYIMNDLSNDDAARLSLFDLIQRSGFDYETYDAVADDGYITVLTRLINPLADKSKLRYPPVVIEHGGTIDSTAYVIASSIQHHPEKYPRDPSDPPMTSWNRSLAFTLCNNGFDVWLAETRGSSDTNHRRIRNKAAITIATGGNKGKNMTKGEDVDMLLRGKDYWAFSQDDIIAHELKSHIDTVLRITDADQINLMTFSLSTPTSLAFLSTRPDYAHKIEGFVSMAPITSGQGVNFLIKLVLETICPILPDKMGTLMITDTVLTAPTRELILHLSKYKFLRYSLVKSFITLLLGPSAKYRTLLDLNVLGHMLRSLSFKEAKQLCQQMKSNRLQKFDYGPMKNMLIYNSTKPPVYDLSNLEIKDWIIVAADHDALATDKNREHLLSLVQPKPSAIIVVPGFNHLDLIVGMDNDKYVNFPIMNYFERKSVIPGENRGKRMVTASRSRSLDFSSMLPPELRIITDTAANLTRVLDDENSPVSPKELMKRVRKDIEETMAAFMNSGQSLFSFFGSPTSKKDS